MLFFFLCIYFFSLYLSVSVVYVVVVYAADWFRLRFYFLLRIHFLLLHIAKPYNLVLCVLWMTYHLTFSNANVSESRHSRLRGAEKGCVQVEYVYSFQLQSTGVFCFSVYKHYNVGILLFTKEWEWTFTSIRLTNISLLSTNTQILSITFYFCCNSNSIQIQTGFTLKMKVVLC